MEKKFTIFNVSEFFFSNYGKFLKTWKVWLSYAFALFLLSVICANWSHSCKDNISPFWWCASLSNVYIIYARVIFYFVISLFISFSFIYDIYNAAFNNKKSGFAAIFEITKAKLKFIGFSFGLVLLFFALLGICFWLIFRKADPNWLVEFGFFSIVFVAATIAVLILRTSASFGVFLIRGKMPDFKYLFQKTHGKFYVVLITFCVLTYAANLLLLKIFGSLDALNMEKNLFILVLGSEFLSSVFKFLVLAAYGAYFLAMGQILISVEEIVEKPLVSPVKKIMKKRNSSAKPAVKNKKTAQKSKKKAN